MKISETPKNNKFIPRRLISSLISSSKTLSSSYLFPSSRSSVPSTPTVKFSQSMMEENIENAGSIIFKWDPNSSSKTKVTSLFHHNRKEANEFLKSVKDLRRAMHFLINENSTSKKLILAQNLMQIAMKRLENEFYQLSKNRDHLDPDSVPGQSTGGSRNSVGEDEVRADEFEIAGESITEVEKLSAVAMTDLKSIAECMISSGYGKECVKIYKVIRKSVVDEELSHLGIKNFRSSQIHKMNREDLEHMIRTWMNAIKIAVRRLFSGERVLCDHVFSASETSRELCFSEITKGGAINLFRFPELIAMRTVRKHSLDKIFQLMELYEAISELWPDIELIFEFESTSAIKLQALSSLLILGDSIRTILSELESTIQKDSSRTLVFGGGVHPLTHSAMTYISSLADFNGVLSNIVVDSSPSSTSPLPDSYFESPPMENGPTPAVSVYLAWLILILVCKLDSKAKLYKDASLSYLFLANNLQFIVEKVCTTNLKHLLGTDWVLKHTEKVKQCASHHESIAWTKVISSLPGKDSAEITPEMAKECFRRFSAAFEEAYRKQTSWLVQDGNLRDELKVSIAKKLVPVYQEFFDTYFMMLSGENNMELLVRFSPDDLRNYLSDLFLGTSTSGCSTSTSSLQLGGCLPR
ncbi:exocyst complex component EXO70H1-like [Carya illinoinensis]|uniref:Exocyst subunit Exo70 family protein n=1 Tax=Carya illinoinensis TaxID=32201 RepID=A0A8T1RFB4_CARIL|nr:exocyst complex component EXO70H1-like [Carya illinoinensis]KAG6665718.1 hypothetical protein CIPAW_02G179400 [Carya illinoinensis]